MADGLGVRDRFPALDRVEGGRMVVYADGPAGTQVPRSIIDAVGGYLREGLSNIGGAFSLSEATAAVAERARAATADLFNSSSTEVAFGQNMTSLTLSASRAIARTWSPGDNIVVTRLDHDANVSPWVIAAAGAGVEVRFCDFSPEGGCALDLEHLSSLLDRRTRLVAVTHASNAVGTIVEVSRVADLAHDRGALVYVDAVHAAPHLLLDVEQSDCDFLVVSAYKFFGPHIGSLYGKEEILESIPPVRIRPAPDRPPGSWETGTQSFEAMAGLTAAIDYLAELGANHASRRAALAAGMARIAEHESGLSDRFMKGVSAMPHIRLYGSDGSIPRVPTFALGLEGRSAQEAHELLAKRGIFTWAGHYYALEVMERLGVLGSGGLLRVGFVHYNTAEDVDRVLEALAEL